MTQMLSLASSSVFFPCSFALVSSFFSTLGMDTTGGGMLSVVFHLKWTEGIKYMENDSGWFEPLSDLHVSEFDTFAE